MSTLTLLTLVVAVAVVLVLASYLIAIAVALRGARRNLTELAAGLKDIAANTRPLETRLPAALESLRQLGQSLAAVDAALADVTGALGIEPGSSHRKAG